LPHLVYIALQGGGIGQFLAAFDVGQTDFGFFPLQALSFTPVWLRRITANCGNHSAIRFDNKYLLHQRVRSLSSTPSRFEERLARAALKYLLRMCLGHIADGAFTNNCFLVLHEFVHHFGKGHIRAKVGQDPL
jgi:hypothetical protein